MLTPETGKSFDLDNSQKYHVLMALEERPDINAVEMEEMKRLFQADITLAITQKPLLLPC